MNENAQAIVIYCSHLSRSGEVKPLEPAEWSRIAALLIKEGLTPAGLLRLSATEIRQRLGLPLEQAERLVRLADRVGSLSFEVSRCENMGVGIITRADAEYPAALKARLGNSCPPLFYTAGDLRLLETPCAGYVGSREIDGSDRDFVRGAVQKTLAHGYGVVSGGARGTDSAAAARVLELGGAAVLYLADSLLKRLMDQTAQQAVHAGRLLLLSPTGPDSGFSAGVAMMRNRFIYAQSAGTVVVKSDLNKGGTWAGATDALKRRLCPVFCRDLPGCPGNAELIRRGAIPIDDAWDGELTQVPQPQENGAQQLSMFD